MQFCDKTAYVQGSLLSMRSFAIEEAPSLFPALYATLSKCSPNVARIKPDWSQNLARMKSECSRVVFSLSQERGTALADACEL